MHIFHRVTWSGRASEGHLLQPHAQSKATQVRLLKNELKPVKE